MVIADTGRGFDINKIDKTKKHLGLQIVSTLVEKDLHGTLEYDSIEPSGTKVLIRFPLESKGE